MERQFVGMGSYPRVLTRRDAKGYQKLVIDDSVKGLSAVEFVEGDSENDEKDTIHMVAVEATTDSPEYILLTKEVGVIGGTEFMSDISVMFFDEGWMLVTLRKGALLLDVEDRLLVPSVGVETIPAYDVNSIYWVNSETLLSYGRYYESKGLFMYDFEFSLTIGGGISNGINSFRVRHNDEEDIDMSLGTFALYQQSLEAKNRMKYVNQISAMMYKDDEGGIEFEDDEDDEDENEDDGVMDANDAF